MSSNSSPISNQNQSECSIQTPTQALKYPSISSIACNRERVDVLYSPLRPKSVNPEHYNKKINFWARTIEEYCQEEDTITFSGPELQVAFRVNDKDPVCITDVLDYLRKEGFIYVQDDFVEFLEAAENSVPFSSQPLKWTYSLIKDRASSIVGNITQYFSSAIDPNTRFLHIEALKKNVTKVMSKQTSLCELMSVDDMKWQISSITGLSDKDRDILLLYMDSIEITAKTKIGNHVVTKLITPGTSRSICDIEKGKYDVEKTKKYLEEQLNETHSKYQKAELNARKFVAEGKRNAAKHELRRKKLLEQKCDKLMTVLDNVTMLSLQIEDAESDAMVLQAYKAGKSTLAKVLQENKLSQEEVVNTVLDVQDILEEHSDISAALSQPLEEDDGSLEQELELLMQKSGVPQPPPQPVTDEVIEETRVVFSDINIDATILTPASRNSPSLSPTSTSPTALSPKVSKKLEKPALTLA